MDTPSKILTNNSSQNIPLKPHERIHQNVIAKSHTLYLKNQTTNKPQENTPPPPPNPNTYLGRTIAIGPGHCHPLSPTSKRMA